MPPVLELISHNEQSDQKKSPPSLSHQSLQTTSSQVQAGSKKTAVLFLLYVSELKVVNYQKEYRIKHTFALI